MGKATQTAISFDREFLSKLSKDSNSSVVIRKDVKLLPMHPFRLTDINASLKDILQQQIAKYDEQLGGILLGYQNARFLERDPVTFDGSFTNLDIEAEFYVFQPVIGNVLIGVVNKKSKDHVGCLVYKTFNVSLPRPKDQDTWLGHKAQIGNEVKFRITFTDLDSKLPYIRGEIVSITSDDSGFSTEDGSVPQNTVVKFNDSDEEIPDSDTNVRIEEQTPSKKKKKHRNIDTPIPNIMNDNEETLTVKSKKSRKAKKDIQENSEELTMEVDEEHESFSGSKKHKKKKHKLSKDDSQTLEEPEEDSPKKSSRKKRKMEESYGELSEGHKKHKYGKRNASVQEEESVEDNTSQEKISKKERKSKEINYKFNECEVSIQDEERREINVIEEECPEMISKKKKRKLEEVRTKSKKHDMSVDDEEYTEDKLPEELPRKKRKSKKTTCDLEEPIDKEEIKHKKHKRKSHDVSIEDNLIESVVADLDEIVTKKKKHKKKCRDDDVYNPIEELNESEVIKKNKKHKKKKHKDNEDD